MDIVFAHSTQPWSRSTSMKLHRCLENGTSFHVHALWWHLSQCRLTLASKLNRQGCSLEAFKSSSLVQRKAWPRKVQTVRQVVEHQREAKAAPQWMCTTIGHCDWLIKYNRPSVPADEMIAQHPQLHQHVCELLALHSSVTATSKHGLLKCGDKVCCVQM